MAMRARCSRTLHPLAAAQLRGTLGIILITASFALTGLGSQPLLQLTFQSYIVECVDLDDRSPAFARLGESFAYVFTRDAGYLTLGRCARECYIRWLGCVLLGQRGHNRCHIVSGYPECRGIKLIVGAFWRQYPPSSVLDWNRSLRKHVPVLSSHTTRVFNQRETERTHASKH